MSKSSRHRPVQRDSVTESVIKIIMADDKLFKYIFNLVQKRLPDAARSDPEWCMNVVDYTIEQAIKDLDLGDLIKASKNVSSKLNTSSPSPGRKRKKDPSSPVRIAAKSASNSSRSMQQSPQYEHRPSEQLSVPLQQQQQESEESPVESSFQPGFSSTEPTMVDNSKPKRRLKQLNKHQRPSGTSGSAVGSSTSRLPSKGEREAHDSKNKSKHKSKSGSIGRDGFGKTHTLTRDVIGHLQLDASTSAFEDDDEDDEEYDRDERLSDDSTVPVMAVDDSKAPLVSNRHPSRSSSISSNCNEGGENRDDDDDDAEDIDHYRMDVKYGSPSKPNAPSTYRQQQQQPQRGSDEGITTASNLENEKRNNSKSRSFKDFDVDSEEDGTGNGTENNNNNNQSIGNGIGNSIDNKAMENIRNGRRVIKTTGSNFNYDEDDVNVLDVSDNEYYFGKSASSPTAATAPVSASDTVTSDSGDFEIDEEEDDKDSSMWSNKRAADINTSLPARDNKNVNNVINDNIDNHHSHHKKDLVVVGDAVATTEIEAEKKRNDNDADQSAADMSDAAESVASAFSSDDDDDVRGQLKEYLKKVDQDDEEDERYIAKHEVAIEAGDGAGDGKRGDDVEEDHWVVDGSDSDYNDDGLVDAWEQKVREEMESDRKREEEDKLRWAAEDEDEDDVSRDEQPTLQQNQDAGDQSQSRKTLPELLEETSKRHEHEEQEKGTAVNNGGSGSSSSSLPPLQPPEETTIPQTPLDPHSGTYKNNKDAGHVNTEDSAVHNHAPARSQVHEHNHNDGSTSNPKVHNDLSPKNLVFFNQESFDIEADGAKAAIKAAADSAKNGRNDDDDDAEEVESENGVNDFEIDGFGDDDDDEDDDDLYAPLSQKEKRNFVLGRKTSGTQKAAKGFRVKFADQLVSDVQYRDRITPAEKPLFFSCHSDEMQWMLDYSREQDQATEAGYNTWEEWIEDRTDEDVARDDAKEKDQPNSRYNRAQYYNHAVDFDVDDDDDDDDYVDDDFVEFVDEDIKEDTKAEEEKDSDNEYNPSAPENTPVSRSNSDNNSTSSSSGANQKKTSSSAAADDDDDYGDDDDFETNFDYDDDDDGVQEI